jgi:hypothetical protein
MDREANKTHLEIWMLHRAIQEMVPDLRDVQVRLPGLAVDLLLGRAAVEQWQEILWRLRGPAAALEKGVTLADGQKAGNDDPVPRAEDCPQGERESEEIAQEVDRLATFLQDFADQIRSGQARPNLDDLYWLRSGGWK